MSAIADMRWGPIVPLTPSSGIWVPACAGTTAGLFRRRLPPPWAPAAAHAGPAGGRARAGAIGLGLRPRAHLVQGRLAWPLASFAFDARAVRHDLVGERDPHLVERGLVHLARRAGRRSAARDRDRLGGGIVDHRQLGRAQALDLVAQA